MAQTWTDDVYAAGHTGQTDLQNMENNFTTLKSNFSGASIPANTVVGMDWYDTGQSVRKMRNAANNGWLGMFVGGTSHKILVYRNDAEEGWVIDSSVTDRIVSIKGGTTYTTGGTTAGTWVQPNHTHTTPSHTLTISEIPSHTHTVRGYIESGTNLALTGGDDVSSAQSTSSIGGGAAHSHGNTGGNNTTNTWRPAAAVCTMQYMDM